GKGQDTEDTIRSQSKAGIDADCHGVIDRWRAEKVGNVAYMNANYVIAGNCDQIPSAEEWTKRINEASSETILKLRQHALGCLAQNIQNQQWGVLSGIAERVLTERGVQYQ